MCDRSRILLGGLLRYFENNRLLSKLLLQEVLHSFERTVESQQTRPRAKILRHLSTSYCRARFQRGSLGHSSDRNFNNLGLSTEFFERIVGFIQSFLSRSRGKNRYHDNDTAGFQEVVVLL